MRTHPEIQQTWSNVPSYRQQNLFLATRAAAAAGRLVKEERCSRDKAALAGKGERGSTVLLIPCWKALQPRHVQVHVAKLYPRGGTLKRFFFLRG